MPINTLAALLLSIVGATALTLLAKAGHISPNSLLILCFMVGCGTALLWPAWGASVTEQVPSNVLPAAVALNGVSYNVARSFGPAVGGLIVAAAGGLAAFATAALFYVPLLVAFYLWRRERETPRLPPESVVRATISGARYVLNAPSIRVVIARTLAVSICGASVSALLPLVSRDLLNGNAQLFGALLGSFGLGSVISALNLSRLRAMLSNEAVVRLCTLGMGAGIIIAATSRWPLVTAAALILFGFTWTSCMMILNVTVQTSAPRWVAARALATYQAAVAIGIAFGGWGWGIFANFYGVAWALLLSAAALILSGLLARWMRIPSVGSLDATSSDALTDPNVRMPLTPRSGPIVVEIRYRIDPNRARLFYAVIQRVRSSRMRNGAYGWSIARDIENPEFWIERYHCPTWHDFLRQRNRSTRSERELQNRALEFHLGPEPVQIHRMLERPIGSVRWKETTPDRGEILDSGVPLPVGSA